MAWHNIYFQNFIEVVCGGCEPERASPDPNIVLNYRRRRDWLELKSNMGYIYILKSERNGKYYVGSTINLEKRLGKHLSGQVYSTKRMLPVQIVFSQKYPNIKTARNIENKLKKLKRRDYLNKIIQDGYIELI